MSEQNDDQFEHDDLIDSLYRDSAGELPPAKIDNLILAKAKGQTVAVQKTRKPRWAIPLVAVCMPALALGVVLKVGNFSFNDGSYEPAATSSVYNTNDFVLHIPEEDAASKIKRVEKPVFDDLDSSSYAKSNSQGIEAEALGAQMSARLEQDVTSELDIERQQVMEAARSSTEIDDAYNVEIKKLEATTSQADYDNASLASTPESIPAVSGLSEQDIMDLPLAKTEGLDQGATVASEPVMAKAENDEIIVSAARRMPESTAATADAYDTQAMPAPTASRGAAVAMSDSAAQADTEDLVIAAEVLQSCPEQRPDACTKIYQPVCGQRDTGVRCVMAPCNQAVEWLNYDNQCNACADDKVYGYADGACETLILPTE